MKSASAFAAMIAAGLLVAGCSDVAAPPAPSPEAPQESAAPADSSAAPEPPAAPEETTEDPPAPQETAPPEPALDDPACLVGDWRITQSALQSFYDSMDAEAGLTIDGDAGLSFTSAGSFTYTPGFTLTLDFGEMTGGGTITGSVVGAYAASDGVITTSQEDSDITITVTLGGMTMDGSDIGEDFLASVPVNSTEYTCTSEGPVLVWEGGDGDVDILLEAAK